MRVCAADFCCQKNAAPAGPARREYPRCRLEFVVESEFQIGRGEFQAEGLAAAAVEVVLAVAEEADLRQEAEVLVDLHAQSRCNTCLKALVIAAGEAYAAVEEERQNPLVIIFVTGIRRRREDVGAAAVLYFQVLVTERHAHRPSLVEIGDYVRIDRNFTLLTHDAGFYVLLNKWHEFIPQSGKVKIGNNVYFARNCTVFKGVTIGDNCIIGFGSVVTHDIPANSVAVGVPARVVGTVEDYYKKRSTKCISEALAYAKSIEERFHRKPRLDEFWEEFPLFVDKENMHLYPHLPYKRQLRDSFDYWVEHHKRIYDGFEEFLKAAGIE